MATPVKFLFENSFDPPPPLQQKNDAAAVLEAEAEVPEVYSSAELEAAREQGFAQGVNAGAEQAGAAIEAQISRLLEHLEQQMAGLAEEARCAQELATRSSTKLALAVAKKLSATLVSRAPMAEMEAMIQTILSEQNNEPRIVIRLSDQMIEPMKQRLETLTGQSGYMGDVVLFADETLSGSACRIEWADGGAERDPNALERAIDSAVRSYIDASFSGHTPAPSPKSDETADHADHSPLAADPTDFDEPSQ
ncbi:MAG: hypothetical protein HQ511_14900 [Rhodospirillales bacterium]|nr:hypothetical protein [Rhodospirillales bacterium]